MIKDEHKRNNHLNQLYRYRATCTFLLFIMLIAFLVGMLWDSNLLSIASLLLSVTQMMNYLDTDSKIRTIKLYELLFEANTKS